MSLSWRPGLGGEASLSGLAGHFWQTPPISSSDPAEDHFEPFRTCLLWRKTQRSGRVVNARINYSFLPQGPANERDVFVLKSDHICHQKDLGQFAHQSTLYCKRKHLREHQTRDH